MKASLTTAMGEHARGITGREFALPELYAHKDAIKHLYPALKSQTSEEAAIRCKLERLRDNEGLIFLTDPDGRYVWPEQKAGTKMTTTTIERPKAKASADVSAATPFIPYSQRKRLHPVAPVLTPEQFDELRRAKGQTGSQDAYTIYPDVQAYIFERAGSGYNRTVSPATVDIYAKQMEIGAWRLDGQPIQFDWDGNQINGQHRGKASIKADKPYAVYMSFGHDPQDYLTMDQGKKRTAGDLFDQNKWSYPNIAAYMATWISRYNDDEFCSRATIKPDHLFARAIGYGKSDMTRCLKVGKAIQKLTHIPAQYTGAVYYLTRQNSPKEADKFFEGWAKGGARELSIQRKLANDIQALHAEFHKAVLDTIQVAKIILAWNKYAEGKKYRKGDFDWHPERKDAEGKVVSGDPAPVVLPFSDY